MMKAAELIIGRRDLGRLDVLLGGVPPKHADKVRAFLLSELTRAKVVEDLSVPPTVVAMHSTIEFRDDDTGRFLTVKLVYPHEIAEHEHAISVLTPVGAALIGLSEGQSIGYETPDGRMKTLTVLRVLDRAPGVEAIGDNQGRSTATGTC
jgi:regulator of nucleoside diphosphate kinase